MAQEEIGKNHIKEGASAIYIYANEIQETILLLTVQG